MPAVTKVPGSGVVVLDGRLWVFGGGNPFGPFTASRAYTPGTTSWAGGPSLNVGRSFIGGTAVGTTLVAAGGYNGSTTVTTTETLTLTCLATITVTKHLTSNLADPAMFNLQIDGTTYAANVGDGGTTGAVTVAPGAHTISETAGTSGLRSSR